MKFLKNSILFPTCFFVLLLVLAVGVSYKRNPYLVNIQYQSLQDPEADGVEKILVSHIDGVRNCTTENFEYNAEKDRYEYVINGAENTYLNLYLNPLQKFRCTLEYRLKYENSVIDHNDGISVTLYKGTQPIAQEVFSLFDRNTSYRYEPEFYLDEFTILLFASFVLSIACISQIMWKKRIHMLFAEGIMTGIWSVLWICSIKGNVLIEESVFQRFAVICLLLAFLSVIIGLFGNGWAEGKRLVTDISKQSVPSILFLVVTCCVYTPSVLFLGNINEFIMPYHRIAGLVFACAAVSFLFLFAIGLSIHNMKWQYIYSLFLFCLTMGFYIQSNFLNPKMPELNGEPIDWSRYVTAGMYSRIAWGGLCLILLSLIGLAIWKNVKFKKSICYLSVLFTLMQLCSFVVMLFTCRVDDGLYRICEKEGQFTVGDENVIIFLVDCLQVDAVQEYIENTDDAGNALENFTLFTNTIGGGAPTEYAVPVILTGEEYDPTQKLDEYFDEIWQEGCLLNDLQTEKYDVRLYTEADLLKGIPIGVVQNICETSGNKVADNKLFLQKMFQFTNLYIMPLPLKKHFGLDTSELKKCLTVEGGQEEYGLNNISFAEEIWQNHLQEQGGRAFRFYHLWGVHKPYDNDEKLQKVVRNTVEEVQVFQGVMLLLQEYMNELKELGVYDSSTIVIMGDHGRHNTTDAERYPAILVKRAGESHPLQYSDNPVCFRNLVATIVSEIREDYSEYGPGLYDVDQQSDVQRLQTLTAQTAEAYAQYDSELYADSQTGARFIVDDDGSGNLTYREWNPYEINRIQYACGDVIDFRSSGSYVDGLTDRLYPAENGKTASNELTICFDLLDESTQDLELKFTYAGVYNDAQKIRIYANGHKVENVMCTADQIGEEVSVVLPKQYVKEKPVILRMVFPNAVTPNQLDRSNDDTRVLSVTFDKMWLKVANS